VALVAGRARKSGAESRPARVFVKEIPASAAGAQWKLLWEEPGNNADGLAATTDGGILIAQNDKSDVIKLDRNGKASVVYKDHQYRRRAELQRERDSCSSPSARSIRDLAALAEAAAAGEQIQRRPLDCIGGVLNDIAADGRAAYSR
jgi:hypothetical protein